MTDGTVSGRTVSGRAGTRQALFEATLRLARGRGLADVTVDEIAAAAGVAKGTVYYNFGSKDNLVEALLRYGVDELAARLDVTADVTGPVDTTETLDALVDNALRFISDYPGFAQILVSELWRAPGNWHDTLSLLRGEVVGVLKQQLVRLEQAGRLTEHVDVSTAAAGLFGTLLVSGLDWMVFQPERSRADVAGSITQLIRGIGHPPGD